PRASLSPAARRAAQTGAKVIGSLLPARSLDREKPGVPAEGLAALTAGIAENTEELDEIEDLLPDAVRLATETGNLGKAQELAGHAVSMAAGSEIPHRQANALYCRGLPEHDTDGLLTAAERYADAGRPLLSAKALEAAATEFLRGEDRDRARAAFIQAVEIYT